MGRTAQDVVQRNHFPRIEQVIQARGHFRAVAGEGLARIIRAAVDFIVAVGKTAAGQPEAKIRARPDAIDETQLGIHINRRDGQPQREVRAQKIRLVVIIKSVARDRHMALKRLIVAELDQVAPGRINLRRSEQRQK